MDMKSLNGSSRRLTQKSWFTVKAKLAQRWLTPPMNWRTTLSLSSPYLWQDIMVSAAQKISVVEEKRNAQRVKQQEQRKRKKEEEEKDPQHAERIKKKRKIDVALDQFRVENGHVKKTKKNPDGKPTARVIPVLPLSTPPLSEASEADTVPVCGASSQAKPVVVQTTTIPSIASHTLTACVPAEPKEALRCRLMRLYPTKQQRQQLNSWMGCARWTYNQCVQLIRSKGKGAANVSFLRQLIVNQGNHTGETAWVLQTPTEIRENAMRDVLKAVQSNQAKQKEDPSHTYELKFRTRRDDSQSIVISKKKARSEEGMFFSQVRTEGGW
jgi:hypothetical protein